MEYTPISSIAVPISVHSSEGYGDVMHATVGDVIESVMCSSEVQFKVVSMSVSVFTLGAIAVDRYFAICKPLSFRMTVRRAVTGILSIWLAAFTIPVPLCIVYEAESPLAPLVYLTNCYEKKWNQSIQQKVYHILLLCIIYAMPLMLITVSYVCVCRQLWLTIPGSAESSGEKTAMARRGSSNRSMQVQLQARRRAAKMLIIVAVIFAFCYLPLHVLNVLRQFAVFEVDHANRHFFHVPFLVAHWLAFANSAINPIIYNFLSVKFRREFMSTFMCCRVCRQYSRQELFKRRRTVYRGSVLSSSINSTSKTNANQSKDITMSFMRNSTVQT
ncbi:orexin receptor type 2-like isoform X1 [Ptychodera flava]|uniref:orexin receptor type 2-like isoform X1 n=1 Tax=Ptychodera flava TaxID=63121 RepID=UPI00396A590B